jgi:hypothetical protein
MNVERDDDQWRQLALDVARDAFENRFPQRRGFVFGGDYAAYFDNNPYIEADRRELIIARLRDEMTCFDVVEKSCAYWPCEGSSEGYTFAMVMQFSLDKDTDYSRLRDAFGDIVGGFSEIDGLQALEA